MNMQEIIDALWLPPLFFKDFAILAIVLSLIEVSPLKVNPWKWLKEFANLPKRLAELERDYLNDKAYRWRAMILARADHVRRGEKLSEERWSDTITTIAYYEDYCHQQEEQHTGFINGKADAAIEYLKKKYKVVYETGDYLK